MSTVLDASALLVLLQSEPGADVVLEAMQDSVISTVNVSEVVAKLCDNGFGAAEARATLDGLPLGIVDFDYGQALDSGVLRRETRSLGLSLGDRACLALAARLKVAALTADSAWQELNDGVTVRLIR